MKTDFTVMRQIAPNNWHDLLVACNVTRV